jgi:hypothetical protein
LLDGVTTHRDSQGTGAGGRSIIGTAKRHGLEPRRRNGVGRWMDTPRS